MKFLEIPKLYSASTMYKVDNPIETLPEWIREHQESMGLELNPDFQRGHIWNKEQQIKFIEFILAGGQTGLNLYFNHPGWMNDFKGEFVCVDGLQRITTIQKFIDNQIKAFGLYYNEFEGILPSTFSVKININDLKEKSDVLKWYLEINFSGTVHTEDEYTRVSEMINELEKS